MSIDSLAPPAKLSKLAITAAVVAFLFAAIGLVSAFSHWILAFFSVVPLMAGVGILQRRVSSAYGFALFELAQTAVIPLIYPHDHTASAGQLAIPFGFNVAVVLLFLAAGRALAAAGAKRGSMLPWIVISCLLTLPLLFVRAFVITSGGMEDTLMPGDRVLVRTFPRIPPMQGDLVVFHYPADRREIYIKRVIGGPGDRIKIVNQVVYRNAIRLNEPYAYHKSGMIDSYRDNFPSKPPAYAYDPARDSLLRDMLQHHLVRGEVIVPANAYFVMGDNRDNSLDSRYWGFLKGADIFAKPVLIYESKDAGRKSTISLHRMRWSRFFKLL